jgi:hypothetical protein
MTCVVISQPMYFPWVGFIAQMAMADVCIWLDDAQFSKGSFTNRVQVKLGRGRKWMSVPIAGGGSFQRIHDLEAKGSEWIKQHREMLLQSFRGYPAMANALAVFDSALATHGTLCDQLIASAEAQARAFGCMPASILRSSAIGVSGMSTDRVLRLVQAVGGDQYLTGHGASAYLDHPAMNAAGISVKYMNYMPHPWLQEHGDFTPYVTGLDLLAAAGSSASYHLRPASMDWRDFQRSYEQMP